MVLEPSGPEIMGAFNVNEIFPSLNEIRRALINPDMRHEINFACRVYDKAAEEAKARAALAAAARATLEGHAFVIEHEMMQEDARPAFERNETIIANPPFDVAVIFVQGKDKTCPMFVATRVATGPFGIGPDGPMPPVLDLVTALPSRTDGVFSWLVPGYWGDLPEDVDNEEIRLTYLAGLLWVIETYKLKPVGPPR
jgi:hypothetical protein